MENQRLKYWIVTLMFLYASLISESQHPITDQIILHYQEHQDPIASLREFQNRVPELEKKHALTWYTYGFLMKECYKKKPEEDNEQHWRDEAIRCFEMAKKTLPDVATKDNISKAEKYLLGTYYNDALLSARSFQETNENLPFELFEKFETNIQRVQLDQPVAALKSQFYKKLAERHYELWQKADTALTHPKSCIELYKKVLLQDPTDCEALHNTAVLYYNIGVNKIKNIAYQADMDDLIEIQEEALSLFKQALPFAESTFQDCPKNTSQYKALMYIQKSLGNDAAFERLQQEYQLLFPNE